MYTDKLVDVSFCLPCYHVERYVEDCVKSLVNQPFDDICYEIIAIDDCSTDRTFELLVELSKQYKHIRVYKNEENKGVSYTRNRLIDMAEGKYIWFIDPDDMLINGAVHYVKKALAVDADVLLGNYLRIKEDGSYNHDLSENDFLGESIEPSNRVSPVDNHGQKMSACWAGVFKRDFLIVNALRFNEAMIAQEDTLFYYQFHLKKPKLYKAKTYCYLYRIRSTSVMHSRNDERMKKYYFSMIEMLRVYQEHYNNKDYDNEEVLKDKILHSKQNIATCLASVQDDAFVKEQFKRLKKEKIYPFRFRTETLKGKDKLPIKILRFLIPIGFVFRIYRYIYKAKKF